MLVLSRHIGEPIDITPQGGAPIIVTILDIDRNKVRVGIEADESVRINRREVTERINVARKEAAADMIEIPNGLALYADEFGKKWLVVGSDQRIARQRLSYADSKTPVPGDSDLIVEFEAGNQSAAEALAIRLRASDYSSVITRLVDKRHDVGGEA